MRRTFQQSAEERTIRVDTGEVVLEGNLTVPQGAEGVVLFAHGSGSSRHSPRNRFVAAGLRQQGLSTLLVDLLTESEERQDTPSGHLRFDIDLLARRLVGAIDWLERAEEKAGLPVGLFGASTGAGAALLASVERPRRVAAVVSRGGRPDLAGPSLRSVTAPTLLIVGGNDVPVIELNERALRQLASPLRELLIVPGATHLFEEPGALEEVARLAAGWFARHLNRPAA